MIVIYAEKASLAKAIAAALKAGNRIAHPYCVTVSGICVDWLMQRYMENSMQFGIRIIFLVSLTVIRLQLIQTQRPVSIMSKAFSTRLT